jgi:hypothetical protein
MTTTLLPDLTEAFPGDLRLQVHAVILAMPPSDYPRTPDDIGPITLDGRRLRIPDRIYNPELPQGLFDSLSALEGFIAACLYTRHHDGHVRQRALMRVIDIDEAWAAPFLLQMLGEYVLELVEIAANAVSGPRKDMCVAFVRENPAFLELTTHRATSYWNAYFRGKFRNRDDYPALKAITNLNGWLS